jgi:hypothetical protein
MIKLDLHLFIISKPDMQTRDSRISVPVSFRESGTGTGISSGNGNIPGNFQEKYKLNSD